jgi:hypothetical protein
MLEEPRKETTSMPVAALARVAEQRRWVVDRDLLIKAASPGMVRCTQARHNSGQHRWMKYWLISLALPCLWLRA